MDIREVFVLHAESYGIFYRIPKASGKFICAAAAGGDAALVIARDGSCMNILHGVAEVGRTDISFPTLLAVYGGKILCHANENIHAVGKAEAGAGALVGNILSRMNISFLACGPKSSFAITEDHRVYHWGEVKPGNFVLAPKLSKSLSSLKIKKIACGFSHCISINTDGDCFAWGENSAGQLGLGKITMRDEPIRISGISKVTDIAAGFAHSLAISEGSLFSWGLNSHGQLGFGQEVLNFNTPQRVANSVDQIGAGRLFSIYLSGDSCFFTGKFPVKNPELKVPTDFPRRLKEYDPPFMSFGFVGPLGLNGYRGKIQNLYCGDDFAVLLVSPIISNIYPNACFKSGGISVKLEFSTATMKPTVQPQVRF